MNRPAHLLAWLVAAAVLGTTVPAGAQSTPDADAIFARARSVAEARTLPPYLEYTTYAAFVRKGHVDAEHYHVIVRTADGTSYVTPVPDSPADRIDTTPYVQKAPPYFWPATTFGLARAQKNDSETVGTASGTVSAQPQTSPSPLAVIGGVRAISREYTVTLAGTEMLEGVSVYHLLLAPRYDPSKHQLREAFIDTQTYQTRRLIVAVSANAGPIHSQPRAVIDYAPVGDAWLVAHGSIDFTLRFGFLAFSGSGEFRLSDMRAVTDEPDWMFDRTKLLAHRRG